jgi:peptidoglycan hydrolase CwlO-like protein
VINTQHSPGKIINFHKAVCHEKNKKVALSNFSTFPLLPLTTAQMYYKRTIETVQTILIPYKQKGGREMKKTFFITVLVLGLLSAYSYAEMEGHMMHQGMMGGPGSEEHEGVPGEYMMNPYMMGGMMGRGMMGGCGMMGGMMGRGMMGGCDMMGGGMMGSGMMGGCGMGPGMWGYGYQQKAFQKFLDDTKDLRKELHNLKFEYFEAVRNPDSKPEDIDKLEKEMNELQKKIYEKWK